MLKASIIIPFFGKIEDLENCLEGLNKQTVLPNEVIIISNKALELPVFNFKVKMVISNPPICVALNAGLKVAECDIICFTDPDAVPYPEWIEKILKVYEDDKIGGVGGRDEIYRYKKSTKANKVRNIGKITWFGRIIGNHHEISAKSREEDFLKGCNMSFRKELISDFDENLLGFYLWEIDMCSNVRAKGYKLVYTPEIKTKHFKEKEIMTLEQVYVTSYNTAYLYLKHLSGIRRIISILYIFLIGQKGNLGFLRSYFLFLSSPSLRIFDFTEHCLLGKVRGVSAFFRNKKSRKLSGLKMIIGVTGGIGSGKSAVAGFFRKCGAEIIEVDKLGWEILDEKQEDLIKAFGNEILENGKINRKKLGKIVFNSPQKLQILNSIIHPPLIERLKQLISNKAITICVVDCALIYEWGIEKWFDKIIVVTASYENKIKKLAKLEYTEAEIKSIMSAQTNILSQMESAPTKKRNPDFVIENDGALEILEQKARKVWQKIVTNA